MLQKLKIMIYVQLYLIYMLLKDDSSILFIIQLRLSIVKWNRKCLLPQLNPSNIFRNAEEDYGFGGKGDVLI